MMSIIIVFPGTEIQTPLISLPPQLIPTYYLCDGQYFISNDKDSSSKYFSLKLKIFRSAFLYIDVLDLVFLEIEF